jgi:HEAT repeat protein
MTLLSTYTMTDRATIKRIRAAIHDRDPEVRAHAVAALVILADTPGLLRALRSRDAHVRVQAVRGLATCRGLCVGLGLAAVAFDADTDVRCTVASAFARRPGWLAICILLCLARDQHAVVRYTALTVLADSRWRGAQRLLRRVETGDREGWLRDGAAALLHRGGPAPRSPRPGFDSTDTAITANGEPPRGGPAAHA